MEFNKNNDNNNGGDEHQQLRGSARKRTFDELTKDGDKSATGEEDQPEPEDCSNSKKNREDGNDGLNLELESLSRGELIKLVRKQMEAAKKEAGEKSSNAKQQQEANREIASKMEEFKTALLASQQKVEELTSGMAKLNAEYQKLLELLNQQIVKLPHEKEEEIADDAENSMKIQLSLETWYDWLSFVPRHRLGQVVPMIGDRKFASIVQKFLHEYGEITIDRIQIVAPYEDPDGHPRVRTLQNNRPLRFEMAEAQMPANTTNFKYLELSYFNEAVLNFMQKFKQNGLLDNANLWFDANLSSKNIVQPILCHLLPLINGIVSIYLMDSALLVDFYDTGNSEEIYKMNMKMMEQTRFLCASYDPESLHAKTIDLYCCWLYQIARADGKPRVLQLGRLDMDSAPISLFINRIKKDFLMATDPVSFFIRIILPEDFQSLEDICLDNDKTKERLVTKMEKVVLEYWDGVVLLISRYPLGTTKKWIVANEKEVLNINSWAENGRTIFLTDELKVVPI